MVQIMKKNDLIELEIVDLNADGSGVGKMAEGDHLSLIHI